MAQLQPLYGCWNVDETLSPASVCQHSHFIDILYIFPISTLAAATHSLYSLNIIASLNIIFSFYIKTTEMENGLQQKFVHPARLVPSCSFCSGQESSSSCFGGFIHWSSHKSPSSVRFLGLPAGPGLWGSISSVFWYSSKLRKTI